MQWTVAAKDASHEVKLGDQKPEVTKRTKVATCLEKQKDGQPKAKQTSFLDCDENQWLRNKVNKFH